MTCARTLVFTNVRSQAERIAHEMENAGEPASEIDVIEAPKNTRGARSEDRRAS